MVAGGEVCFNDAKRVGLNKSIINYNIKINKEKSVYERLIEMIS